MSDEDQKQTTEGITFRIPSRSINQLREESKKKQISLNWNMESDSVETCNCDYGCPCATLWFHTKLNNIISY